MRLVYGYNKRTIKSRIYSFTSFQFGSYLLLGLEFMIAADIIYTIAKPNTEGLITLGSIVAIRTVISYFLNKEIEGRHNCQDKMK